ncbi:RTA1 like protein-domain-containing protein [Corynascus novoguineensis]|uniref:RTA1 like protein-domain-containing protein n=1 Tax=Corynascus novoguineensis TaxID=1126955 RepID=A0AAN7HKR2_9PEZI|nr:RTA1 like protein-domain-containing protein [Corynascus novoguineensis]
MTLVLRTTTQLVRREDDCVYVTPGPNGYVPPSDTACNAYYLFNPQYAPAVAVAVIFGVFTGIHVVEAFVFKKRYAWVLIMGSSWETLAFVLHSFGARDQQNLGYSISWTLLFLLAPLWINAFAYMTFARMVHYWHPEGRVGGMRAAVIARWFVVADILCFLVQLVGGVMANPQSGPTIMQVAMYVYTGGTSLQQLFILIFLGLMVAFQRRCSRASPTTPDGDESVEKPGWRPLLYALYAVLVCITVRIIFRIVEFSQGFTLDNPIPLHEEYAYALDCFPMMVALLILAVFHPGRYLRGPDSEFPRLSRKEKKALKMDKKEARLAAKAAKKQAKDNKRESGSDETGSSLV